MSTPKLLRNKNTGAVFPYSKILAARKDMLPVFEEAEQAAPMPTQPAPDNPAQKGIALSRAPKAELIAYAKDVFGVQIEDDQTIIQVREQVKKLIEQDG